MGQELLQDWATNEQHQVEQHWDQRPGVARKQKKESTGTPSSGA